VLDIESLNAMESDFLPFPPEILRGDSFTVCGFFLGLSLGTVAAVVLFQVFVRGTALFFRAFTPFENRGAAPFPPAYRSAFFPLLKLF